MVAQATPEALWSANWRHAMRSSRGNFTWPTIALSRARKLRSRRTSRVRRAVDDGRRRRARGGGTVRRGAPRSVAGLALRRDNFTLERAGRTLALCGAERRATEILDELARRFPTATLTTRLHRPVILAAMALSRGDAARAVSELDPVRPFDHAPAAEFWPSYLTGLASLRMKDGRSAADAFRDIVNQRGEAPTSPLYGLAHLGLARASVQTNDQAEARKSYEAFFRLWKDADPDVPSLRQARAEYAQLQ